MQITIKSPSTVPAGRYPAVFEGLEEKTSKRDGAAYFRWTFSARTPGGEKEVSGVSSANTGPKSKAYGWLAGLLGRKPLPNEVLEASDLIGQPCEVLLEENEDGFANVVSVLPSRLSEQAIEAYADEADRQAGSFDDLPF